MRKFLSFVFLCLYGAGVQASEISSNALGLTAEQGQRLSEMQEQLKAEVQPIWEEVESGRNRIIEIEKKYFQEFWGLLSEEQKQKFAELQK